MDDLNQKIDELASSIEKRFEDIHKQIEERFTDGIKKTEVRLGPKPRSGETPFWGIVLFVIGIVLLGNHMRWFYMDIPLIPAALIILGGYLIIRNL